MAGARGGLSATSPKCTNEPRKGHVNRDGDPDTDEYRENDCPHTLLRIERSAESGGKRRANVYLIGKLGWA